MMRPTVAREVEDEIAFHIEMTVRELVAHGMSLENARAEATRRFGSVASVNAECQELGRSRERRAKRAETLVEIVQDARFALRQLGRSRTFTTVAVLTLALGIGATTTVFSALYAVVLQPLPFEGAERVVALAVSEKGEPMGLAAAEYVGLHDNARVFQHMAATVHGTGFTITDGDVPELVGGGRVTAAYFHVFGARPLLGRVFTADEDTPGRGNVVVLSHRAWQSRHNGDPGVVGRTTRMNGQVYSIIGVMPAAFDITREGDDLWVPLALSSTERAESGSRFLNVVARLAPGVSLEQARRSASAIQRATVANFSDRRAPASEAGAIVTRFIDDMVGGYRSLLFILLGAVGFVLLIACTNVANLLLARGSVRAKELAIRAALSAGRARLVRQMLTESVLLAFIGATLGLGVAYALLEILLRVGPDNVPRLDQARIDWHVMAFTLAIAAISSLLFGLVPALRAAGPHLQGTLRDGGRDSATSGRGPLRQLLVASEVALAMTLLTGSGLLIRSAWLLQRVDPGFDPRGVMTARILLPEARYDNPASIVRAYGSMKDEAARLPGVASAALVSVLPLSGAEVLGSVTSDNRADATETPSRVNFRLASTGYFRTMRIPVRAGRDIAPSDDGGASPVVVVNEELARRLWPGVPLGEVIGRRLNALAKRAEEPHWMTVVGIVGNIRDGTLGTPAEAEFYVPVPQTPGMLWPYLQRSLVLLVRGVNDAADAARYAKPLANAVAIVDPTLPLADPRTMLSYVASSLETSRFNTLLLSTLGGVALVLAMVGVYGVVAWFVTQRTHEIGVRVALGATPASIWTLVVSRGLSAIVIGMLAGVALSLMTGGVLQGQLYGVSKGDPYIFGFVGVLLLGVSVIATYVPARRAMRISPMEALRGA